MYHKNLIGLIKTLKVLNTEVDFYTVRNKIVTVLLSVLTNGKAILIAGNGGSAAQASHFAGELVGRFKKERKGYPCIALNTDTTILTALGNDYGYENIFKRQIEALGKAGDCLLVLSTSGKSKNLIKAVEEAQNKGMKTVAIIGGNNTKLNKLCDVTFNIPSTNTPTIQEVTIFLLHDICQYLELVLSSTEE